MCSSIQNATFISLLSIVDTFLQFKTLTVGKGLTKETLRYFMGSFNNEELYITFDENNTPRSSYLVGKASHDINIQLNRDVWHKQPSAYAQISYKIQT